MKRTFLRAISFTSLPLLLSSCLLIAPYHGQILNSRTDSIPFQAWSNAPSAMLKVECMPTNRFGPERSPHGSWTQFTTVSGSSDATRDLRGSLRYSASKMMSLPQSCWYLNQRNGWYYTSLRVLHEDYMGDEEFSYFTLNRDGINCTTSSVSTSGYQLQWLSDGCQQKYSDSNTAIKWIVISTQS